MATSTIKPKKGTTAQWAVSERVLEVNEWGVEETEKGTYILRIGNGQDKFLDLPIVMDVGELKELAEKVEQFANNPNQLPDDSTGTVYALGVENGNIYIMEV